MHYNTHDIPSSYPKHQTSPRTTQKPTHLTLLDGAAVSSCLAEEAVKRDGSIRRSTGQDSDGGDVHARGSAIGWRKYCSFDDGGTQTGDNRRAGPGERVRRGIGERKPEEGGVDIF